MKLFIREHWAAIVLATLAALIVASPQVVFRIDHRDDGIYQGIELMPDSPWSARVREVQDGHPSLGSIYFKEGKDDPYLFQPLGSIIVGYVGSALGLGINNTLLASRLVFTFAAFLLIYGFVYLLSRERGIALASAAILLLAESLMSTHGLSELLHGRAAEDFLRIGRPVYPALIYLSLFSFLITFWLFFKKKNCWYGAASALLLGLNFYTYFYSWTYLYAFGGILGLMLLIQKKWREASHVALVYVGAVIVAIPYGLKLFEASSYPGYVETGARFGVVVSHAPLFVGIVVLAALVVFFTLFPKEDRERYFFGIALLLAPLITMNQQLITGKILQPAHYHWFFHKPMALIFVLIALSYLMARFLPKYRTTLVGAVIVSSFAVGIFVQVDSYVYGHAGRDGGVIVIERQKYGPVMNWLSEHGEKEEVVFANNETSHMTVIYTPLNVFYHRAGVYSLAATSDRLHDTLFTFYRLRGVDAEDARGVFLEERGTISSNLYGMEFREISGSYDAIPEGRIEAVAARYIESLEKPIEEWLELVLKKYGVAYVVWDVATDPEWNMERFSFLELAAEYGDFRIYRVAL